MTYINRQEFQCLFVTLKILAQYTTQHIIQQLEKAGPAMHKAGMRHGHIRRFHNAVHRAMSHQAHGGSAPWSSTMTRILNRQRERCPITRYFSTLNSRMVPKRSVTLYGSDYLHDLTKFSATKLVSRTFFSAVNGVFTRERNALHRLANQSFKVMDAFAMRARRQFELNRANKFVHNYGQPLKPMDVIRSNWKDNGFKSRRINSRQVNRPTFIFPQPSLRASFSTSSLSSASSTSSLPSLRDLRKAFYSIPNVGSYVDFDMSPTITIPPVSQLSNDIVDNLTQDIERHIAQLQAMAENVKKLATLGELPISIENSSLRVYFPNCEPEQVHSLLNSTEVTQGTIRSQNDSNIISSSESVSETSSSMSFYLNSSSSYASFPSSVSQNGDHTPEFGSTGFYYADEGSVSRRNSLSSGSWDIARLRGFSSESEASPSVIPPSLTNAPSGVTVSEGSSAFLG